MASPQMRWWAAREKTPVYQGCCSRDLSRKMLRANAMLESTEVPPAFMRGCVFLSLPQWGHGSGGGSQRGSSGVGPPVSKRTRRPRMMTAMTSPIEDGCGPPSAPAAQSYYARHTQGLGARFTPRPRGALLLTLWTRTPCSGPTEEGAALTPAVGGPEADALGGGGQDGVHHGLGEEVGG